MKTNNWEGSDDIPVEIQKKLNEDIEKVDQRNRDLQKQKAKELFDKVMRESVKPW